MTAPVGTGTSPSRTVRRPNPAIFAMSEDELLANVRTVAALTGWRFYHTHNSQHSPAGFPDVVLLSLRQRRVLYAELKRETGRVSTAQQHWISDLRALGYQVAVWRPHDWFDDTIRRVLQGAPLHLETS